LAKALLYMDTIGERYRVAGPNPLGSPWENLPTSDHHPIDPAGQLAGLFYVCGFDKLFTAIFKN
jgi:hypothetical protein